MNPLNRFIKNKISFILIVKQFSFFWTNPIFGIKQENMTILEHFRFMFRRFQPNILDFSTNC